MNYINHKEKVWKNITKACVILEVYHAYTDSFYTQKYFESLDNPRTPNIIIYIKNALLSDFYVTLRNILGLSCDEASLPNLLDTLEAGIEYCLPNSHEKWSKLKKHINTNITHTLTKPVLNDNNNITWQDIRVIANDIKQCFDAVTLKNENATYRFEEEDAADLSKELFDIWKNNT